MSWPKKACICRPQARAASGVRHDLQTMQKRLTALEALSAREGRMLTEAKVAALERVQHEKEVRGDCKIAFANQIKNSMAWSG
jgi:hypothetical protein